MSTDRERTLRTDYLARVEGEGAMYVQLAGSEVRDVKLRIYEPPRFFEAFLRGRSFTEVADITARICGICPIAYQISSLRAVEDACGVAIDEGPIRDLRRLIYCGEWIESHGLHVYLLHAPDFLGYPGFLELARDHPQIAERGLQMKKAGNTLVEVVGGRAVHPINMRVGGLLPSPVSRPVADTRRSAGARPGDRACRPSRGRRRSSSRRSSATLSSSRCATAIGTRLTAGRSSPTVASRPRPPGSTTISSRSTSSTQTHSMRACASEEATSPARSRATTSARRGCGRSPARRRRRRGSASGAPTRSKASSCARSSSSRRATKRLSIIASYEPPDRPALDVEPRAGIGHGTSEAPRGMLYHRYEIDERGDDPRCVDRAADLAEPARDRGGPAGGRRALSTPLTTTRCATDASRRSATTTRASRARPTSWS